MPRRRRRRRKGKRSRKEARLLRFRMNQINAAGGAPVTPSSRIVRTVASSNIFHPGTTAGADAVFNIMDWSTPADPVTTGFTQAGTALNKPSGFDQILADGYDRVRVLSSMYRFNIRFRGDDNVAQDWIFGYKFNTSSSLIFTHTAGTIAIDNFKDLRQSRGWVWQRMSAIGAGGSVYPTTKQVNVRISNVQKLAKAQTRVSGTDHTWHDYGHAITAGADSADVNSFLVITVMTIDGIALSLSDVQIDIDVFQKVKVWKAPSDFGVERAVQVV